MNLPLIGKITFWKAVLIMLILLTLFIAFVRFSSGLGAATNLSDTFPWGIWIGFDLLVGVGLAAGGFVLAATVHIFGLEKFKPVSNSAILTAFLGYLLVIVALIFDLGQPWRIWHPLIMWNPHSVMFEVAWCVMLYTSVLALEFSPHIFSALGWEKPYKFVKLLYIPLVIAGVLLSTMHQSSLGSLYLVMPDKLHGLWYTGMLPVFFFTSAIAAALGMTIIESYLSSKAFKKQLETDLLRSLGKACAVVLAVFATMRLNELIFGQKLHLMFEISKESVLFWGEFGLGVILPIFLFANKKIRHNKDGLFFAALLTVLGFILNRLNVAITGLQASSGVDYFPSWMEVVITTTLVAIGFFLFSMAVKHLNIFGEEEHEEAPVLPAQPVFSKKILFGLWTLFFIGAAAVFFINLSGETTMAEEKSPLISEFSGQLNLPEDFVYPQGEDSPGEVTFSHDSHVDTSNPNCNVCHKGATFSFNLTPVAEKPKLDYDTIHTSGAHCNQCHNGTDAFNTVDEEEENCMYCHQ